MNRNLKLSKQQTQVLSRYAADYAADLIMEDLKISINSLNTYTRRIRTKYKRHSIAGCIAPALRNNCIQQEEIERLENCLKSKLSVTLSGDKTNPLPESEI